MAAAICAGVGGAGALGVLAGADVFEPPPVDEDDELPDFEPAPDVVLWAPPDTEPPPEAEPPCGAVAAAAGRTCASAAAGRPKA
jgi:hypothetical protein